MFVEYASCWRTYRLVDYLNTGFKNRLKTELFNYLNAGSKNRLKTELLLLGRRLYEPA